MPIRRQYQPIGSIVNNVTASRALDVTYQNTSGVPLLVVIGVQCRTLAAGDGAIIWASVGATTPPLVDAATCGISAAGGAVGMWSFTISFVVPIGYYYRALRTLVVNGTVTLAVWHEVQLIAPFSAGF